MLTSRSIPTAEVLLRVREARGLQVPAVARIIFIIFGLISAITGLPQGPVFYTICALSVFVIAVNTASLYALRRHTERLELVGWVGVALDVAILAIYPLLQWKMMQQLDLPLVFAAKTLFLAVCVTFIAINALAIRPAYPLAICAVSEVIYGILLASGLADPTVRWARAPKEVLAGNAISVDLIISQMVFLALIGAAIVALCHVARRTVLEAVEQEANRARNERRQADLVMQERMASLRKIVSSVSHEMNSPLGAAKSSAATAAAAATKVRAALGEGADTGRVDKLLAAIESAGRVSEEATGRLEHTLSTLRAFSHLDKGEVQRIDLHQELERTLSMLPKALIGASTLSREFTGRELLVDASAARINLAFMTIITNAFEAVPETGGTVVLRTVSLNGEAVIEIRDNGRGIPPELLPHLFDIRFDQTDERVKAGYGLAAAYAMIRQHNGSIKVDSTPEAGSCFIVRLPLAV